VTNGNRLRILRDFFHEITKGYIEFDLREIFSSQDYDDFRALYRLAHRSRYEISEDEETGQERIERIYDESKEIGVSVGKDLRSNIRKAIEVLANGFLKEKTRNR